MPLTKLLIANRGEIAVRISQAACVLGIECCGLYAQDDRDCLHTEVLPQALPLPGRGVAAYLNVDAILEIAHGQGCDALHPGYGFLSENPDFAQQVEDAGLLFIGPKPETLALFGDKVRARQFAAACGVPTLAGLNHAVTLAEAESFFADLPIDAALVIKAVGGAGGRGMRVVSVLSELASGYQRCRSEAEAAIGNPNVYVERYLPDARHIEVQTLGDGEAVAHLWERDCSIQRRHQKIIEIAPAPLLSPETRARLHDAALRMAGAAHYRSLGTFEFLVTPLGELFFIEANARLQVEHTITEAVTGVDLVVAQLRLAAGVPLAGLELPRHGNKPPGTMAIQCRVLAETLGEDGVSKPASGCIQRYEPPSGAGVRVDGVGYAGYKPNAAFDSLLAKLVVQVPGGDLSTLLRCADVALRNFRIQGIHTNVPLLRALVQDPELVAWRLDTGYIGRNLADILRRAAGFSEQRAPKDADAPGIAGAVLSSQDPLALFDYGRADGDDQGAGTKAVRAPMQCTVVSVDVRLGDEVQKGQQLLVLAAMKMEHVLSAPHSGLVGRVVAEPGMTVPEHQPLLFLAPRVVEGQGSRRDSLPNGGYIRPDLAEVRARHVVGLDESRSEAVAKRHSTGRRTARANVTQLCDSGSFVEYGPLVIAAQRRRRSMDDLIHNTPGDGMVAGIGRVNGDLFPEGERARCIVMSYDYMVLAGTQGQQNHRKKDRMFELAERLRCPLVIFAEGGGGRPGDTDGLGVAGLDCLAFRLFGRLSGLAPTIGIVAGRCFAGNAALFGCCDLTIATLDANIGMGGPAMIEGGGLGVFRPEQIGPAELQATNGVVDILVKDEAEAVGVARRYLSYFQGTIVDWSCADQATLRHLIPENRLRIYDVRTVIDTMMDKDSVLELRAGFGLGMITALTRVEGRPLGVIANNPAYLAGAIDSDGADKAARFMQLCDAFDVPLLFLCDCPGIMVGPEAEKTALVRHACRLFVIGASLDIPFFTMVLRKAYGLGAQAMAGGSFKAPRFTVSWPTGEFGGMGLEGAVKLGYRKELAAVADAQERQALFSRMVDRMYERGKAVNAASHFELDDVIDPADSRRWIVSALRAEPPPRARPGKKRPGIDPW